MVQYSRDRIIIMVLLCCFLLFLVGNVMSRKQHTPTHHARGVVQQHSIRTTQRLRSNDTPRTQKSFDASRGIKYAKVAGILLGTSTACRRTDGAKAVTISNPALISTSSCTLESSSILDASSSNMISKAATVEEGGFISGLVSGAVSRASKEIILHPIDTVRARLQTSPDLSLLPKRVLADSDEVTVTNENLFDDLYSGLTPALIGGIPAGALFFGVKDYTKKKFRKMGLGKAEATLLSVLMANFPYWVVRTPSEVLKTRQQTDNSEDATSMMAMIRSDLAQKGLANATSSIYDSYIPNIAYAFPADAVKFLVYEYLSATLYGVKEGQKVKGLDAAITGALAGLVAQLSTTPLDVVRTRIMTKDRRSNYVEMDNDQSSSTSAMSSNPIAALSDILAAEGVDTLFKGSLPRGVRAIGSGAIQFATYELTQNAFKS